MTVSNKSASATSKDQNFEKKNAEIRIRYLHAKRTNPAFFSRRIDLSWSIWMFGLEPIGASLDRLTRNDIRYVELKGDHWTSDSGIRSHELSAALAAAGVRVSGACGMFSQDNDLSSPSAYARQNAIDYIRRELDFLAEVDARYLIVVPTAVGRPVAKDTSEVQRSAEALRRCGDDFARTKIRAAIEPIRASEVSLVHTVSDAIRYLEVVGHPAIAHINGDVYHMSLEERNVGEAILLAGDKLANLHLADTNRDALGTANLDLDTVIMAAYLAGMNQEGRFLTPEPLGPFPDPYVLSNSPCNVSIMDELVRKTVSYFREREEIVRSLE
ncbi:Sugar phosphate isomerase/epimerase [uncultured spirochete]|uniref:Sugar phosphate isomerase/epimerase n=1 Tax=uncultured spirochete TaxID=156406 RepID=A0A3P3XPZ2_9SPIR|nr:Sugar phosphate isomerase/epimerase [uncultured spirochete]